jgi:N-acyl-D-aspartate/D-glutamate deacylase
MSWGIIASRHQGGAWRDWLAFTDRAAERGGRIFAQVHAREFTVVLSFKTRLPFDVLPEGQEVRRLPLDAQRKAFEDPETRARLVAAAHDGRYGDAIGAETRKPDFDWVRVVNRPTPPNPTVNELAAERGIDPVELMIDLALETDFDQLFGQVIGNDEPETVLELMKHPRSVVTFSDSGAHVSQIMDSSLATHVLGHHVREQQSIPLEHAVRMLTYEPATAWGFADRGLVREGFAADLVVFDPATIAPCIPEVHFDLPGGARRLLQRADGILATVVGGRVLLRNGEHTGAFPGRLIRGRVAASA